MASKIEDITVMGTVLYCDRCDARGPAEVGESHEEVAAMAREQGWHTGDGTLVDPDLCPKCAKNAGKEG